MSQKKQDNRIIGEQHEIYILSMIAEFGFIIVAIASYAVWWYLPSEKAKVLARRVLLRLETKGEVIRRKVTGYQISFFVLSEKGAARLRARGIVYAKTGKDVILGNQIEHDVMAMWVIFYVINNAIVECRDAGKPVMRLEYLGEHGCRRRELKIDKKTADGIIVYDKSLTWIEIENSWKNVQRREKVANFWAQNFRYSGINKMKLELLIIAGSKDGVERMMGTISSYKYFPDRGYPDKRYEARSQITYIVIELDPDLNMINIYHY